MSLSPMLRPRMLRSRKPRLCLRLGALCLIFAAATAQATPAVVVADIVTTQVPEAKAPDTGPFAVEVGTRTVLLPRLDGYVGMYEMPTQFRTLIEQATPPTMRLLQASMHVDDLNMQPSEYSDRLAFDAYALRSMEDEHVSDAEWASTRQQVAAGLRRADAAPHVSRNAERLNDAFQTYTGGEIRYEAGKPGEQVVYRVDARSVRMHLVLPSRQTIAGEVYDVEMVRVVSINLVRGRIVYLGGSLEFPAGKVDIAHVVRATDAYIDAVHRLNPAQDD